MFTGKGEKREWDSGYTGDTAHEGNGDRVWGESCERARERSLAQKIGGLFIYALRQRAMCSVAAADEGRLCGYYKDGGLHGTRGLMTP